jgi:hypothetical protein
MSFTHYLDIAVDHNKVNSGNQTNFPVRIAGTYGWAASLANSGKSQNASGFDIRPYSDSGLTSAYTYQLHSYNPTTGAFSMTVLIPTLSASADTHIYMGVGDAALTTDASSTSVWDSNYKGVWQLSDGSTLKLTDLTSNAVVLSNVNSVTATAGIVGGMGAASFNGTSQSLDTGAVLVSNEPITFEALFNPDDSTSSGDMMYSGNTTNTTSGHALQKRVDASGTHPVRAGSFGGASTFATSSTSYTASAWNYAAATFAGITSRDVHLNGATKVSDTANITVATADRFSVGSRFANGTHNNFFKGPINEVRVSNVVRSDSWIKTTDANLRGIATFYSVGTLTATGSPVSVTAGVGVLTATGLAPSLAVTDNKAALPGVAVLVATGLAPTAVATDLKVALPGVAVLVATGLAPTATASDHKIALPDVGALVVTGLAPTATVGNAQSVTPAVGSVIATGFAPTVAITAHQTVTPDVGSVIATGFAPTAFGADTKVATPAVGSVIATGFAPTVASTANQNIAPGLGAVIATGFAPTAVATDHKVALPALATLVATGFAPSIFVGVSVTASLGVLVATGFAPTITQTANKVATPGLGDLIATGFAPVVTGIDTDEGSTGLELALVGDWVGSGTILPSDDPVGALIDYRGTQFALTGCTVGPHYGPAHPSLLLTAVVINGIEVTEIGPNGLHLVHVGAIASCGDPIVKNPSVVGDIIRTAELLFP